MTISLNDFPEISKRITEADFPLIKILYKILYNEEPHRKSRHQVRKFKQYSFDPSTKEYKKFLNELHLTFDLQPIAQILGLRHQRRKEVLVKAIPKALSNLEKLTELQEEDDDDEYDEEEDEDVEKDEETEERNNHENEVTSPTPISYQDLRNEIKQFDGESYSITKWIQDIEDKATLRKLSEIQKQRLARTRLTGIAKIYYENSRNKSWTQLEEVMKRMFSSRTDTTETENKPENRPSQTRTANETNNEKIKEAAPEPMKNEEAQLTNDKVKDELTRTRPSLNENHENDSRPEEKENNEKEKPKPVSENSDKKDEKKIDSKKNESKPEEEAKLKNTPEFNEKSETENKISENSDEKDEKRIAEDEEEESVPENKQIKEILKNEKRNIYQTNDIENVNQERTKRKAVDEKRIAEEKEEESVPESKQIKEILKNEKRNIHQTKKRKLTKEKAKMKTEKHPKMKEVIYREVPEQNQEGRCDKRKRIKHQTRRTQEKNRKLYNPKKHPPRFFQVKSSLAFKRTQFDPGIKRITMTMYKALKDDLSQLQPSTCKPTSSKTDARHIRGRISCRMAELWDSSAKKHTRARPQVGHLPAYLSPAKSAFW